MAYATLADLQTVAADYDVTVPDDTKALRALELASRDLDRYLGAEVPFDVALLTAAQTTALVAAAAIQAASRWGPGRCSRGGDDPAGRVARLLLSARPPLRLSPEAVERVSGVGLFLRSGT